MNKLRCIVIEDQAPAQRILQKYISDTDYLELQGLFSDAISAMAYLNENQTDIIFLDIHLPKISGVEFLKSLINRPAVIMTTAFPDFALESYEYDVVDYLLKPFSFARFLKAVNKVSARTKEEEQAEIFIKSGHEHIKVSVSDIVYINSDNDYTEIHTSSQRILSLNTLRNWEDELSNHSFLRCHKSYIINKAKIQSINSNAIQLSNDIEIPIGRAYKQNLKDIII